VHPKRGEVLQVAIANVGHTPARNVVIISGSTFGTDEPEQLKIKQPSSKDIEGGSMTSLGAGVTAYSPMDFVQLTDEQRTAVLQDKLGAFVYGEIIYNDIFSTNPRHLWFCSRFLPATSSWAGCRTGNDAD